MNLPSLIYHRGTFEFQRIFSIAFILILTSCGQNKNADNPISSTLQSIKYIDNTDLGHNYPLFKFEQISVDGLHLSDKKDKIKNQWGVPKKIEVDSTSPDGEPVEVWIYKNNEIIVSKENDYFIALSVTDKASKIFPNELSIGNSIHPLIASLSEKEKADVIKNGELTLPLLYAGKASDEKLLIRFDSLHHILALIYDGAM